MSLPRQFDLSFERYIDMHRKQRQDASAKQNRHQDSLLLFHIDGQQNHCTREAQTAQHMEWNQKSALPKAQSGGFKFDDSEHSDDKKNNGECDQGVRQHIEQVIAGAVE